MESLDFNDIKKMFCAAAQNIEENEVFLCKLDAVCGDGDHGTAAKGAMSAVASAFEKAQGKSLKQALFDAGCAALSNSNGSTSTLFGSLFMGMSDGIQADATNIDAQTLHKVFEAAKASVKMNTKADVGDKTLMDAFIPAVNALEGKSSVSDALEAAAKAAREGAESTKNLQAKFGRAKNLGEKSIGSQDAGATSIAIIFESFAKTLKN